MKRLNTLCSLMASVILAVPFLSGCSRNATQSTTPLPNPFWKVAAGTDVSSSPLPSAPSVSQPVLSTSIPATSIPSTSNPSGSINTPAVWKAEDNNGHLIYMMGTIHVGDETINNMPDYFETAYQYSDAIAVEADISEIMSDNTKANQYLGKMIYQDGTTIKDHLSAETYNGIVNHLESHQLYNAAYDNYKPFLWTSLLANTMPMTNGLDYYHGIDLIITNRAKSEHKPVYEVESLDYQLDLFNSFSDQLNDLMLSEYLKPGFAQIADQATARLYDCWKKGTVTAEMNLDGTFSDRTEENSALYQEYIEKLLLTRNKHMAEAAEQYLTSGQKVFFMVGVLHFYGDGGIIDLLQQDGYRISLVTF